jgi:hypothetical protein
MPNIRVVPALSADRREEMNIVNHVTRGTVPPMGSRRGNYDGSLKS